MDITTLHTIWTVVLLICFVGVIWWAYGRQRKARFDEAANLIFDDEEQPSSNNKE
ncbi:cbb3-type cytochrome oxidase subunit 3 [Vibrio misgurnus]|uniref:cbb3-type cytochrome oxidase subunit 3 n=1 Tax=Vibrio TaxID=662 RepID=UPI0024164D17|nr:cbb3-type cytochrome oxidase subunit 3 [Vibrio sp. gvc]